MMAGLPSGVPVDIGMPHSLRMLHFDSSYGMRNQNLKGGIAPVAPPKGDTRWIHMADRFLAGRLLC
jgi:hypothetical protein